MEEQLLEHIKLQRPPLILCVTAGTMLILSALQFTLAGSAQKHAPVNSRAVFTPIQLPPAAKNIKPQRNPFLAPAAPDIKRQTAALTPRFKRNSAKRQHHHGNYGICRAKQLLSAGQQN